MKSEVGMEIINKINNNKNNKTMTREETKERIKVMQAYVDGKTIEYYNQGE